MDIAAVFKIKAGVEGAAAVERLNSTLRQTVGNAGDLTGKFNGLRGAFAALGVTAVVAGFVSMVRGAIDSADSLNKLSQKTGIAVEELSKLQYAGALADVSLEQISGAAGKFSKVMGEAARGSREAQQTLRDLGVDVNAVRSGQIGLTEAMAQAGDTLRDMDAGWQKNDLAMRGFGKSGREIIPLLNSDIRAMAAELEAMGGVITGQTAQAAEDFNDNLTRMQWINKALVVQLANDLLPLLNAAALAFLNAKKESTGLQDKLAELRKDNKLVEWAESAATGVAFVIDSLRLLIKVVEQVGDSFSVVLKDLETMGKLMMAANPLRGGLLFNMDEVKAALADRNKYVAEANKRMADRFNDGLVGDKVKNFFAEFRAGKYAMTAGGAGGGGGTGGNTDLEQLKQYEQALKQLQQQLVNTKDLTVAEETLERIRLGHYGKLSQAQQETLVALAMQIDASKQDAELQKEITKLVEEHRKKVEQAKRAEADRLSGLREQYIDLIDPVEKFRKKLAEIDELQAKGMLTKEQALEARFRINEQISDLDKLGEKGKDIFSDLKDAVEGWGRSASAAFVDWAFGAKTSIKDVAVTFLKEMAQMVMYRQVFEPLAKKGGDMLGSILTSVIGSAFGGGGVEMHTGGLVGRDGRMRSVSPAMFAGARRYHTGGVAGLAPDEVPAILQRGERVIPRGGSMGGVNVQVNVDATGTSVQGDSASGNQLGRMIGDTVRGILIDEQRPGGLLAA